MICQPEKAPKVDCYKVGGSLWDCNCSYFTGKIVCFLYNSSLSLGCSRVDGWSASEV